MITWWIENFLHRIAALLDTDAINDDFWDKDEDDIY